jgi:hypothetical protein
MYKYDWLPGMQRSRFGVQEKSRNSPKSDPSCDSAAL